MSEVTIPDFTNRFPEFSETVVEDNWQNINPQWMCYYCGQWGQNACQNEIILNLMAHLLVIETQPSSDSKKDVASKSVGSVSVSYTTGDSDSTNKNALFFNTTKYGQRFLQMIAGQRDGGFFV